MNSVTTKSRAHATVRRASLLAALLLAVPAAAQSSRHGTNVRGRAVFEGTYACDETTVGSIDRTCRMGSDEARVRAYVDASLRLHADASIYDSFRPQTEHVAFAEASYFDRLTFTGEVIPASVRFTMYLHGGAVGEDSYGALSLYHVTAEPSYTISRQGAGPGDPNVSVPGRFPVSAVGVVRGSWVMPVVNGRIDFALTLSAFARMEAPDPTGNVYCALPAGCSGMGVRSNFYETAALELLTALDENGNEIAGGVQVLSASGHTYAVAGIAATTTAPEPATCLLVGTGMLGLVVAGARRRREGLAT